MSRVLRLIQFVTAKIEELISELSTQYTIAIVTHSMQQAARVSDRTAYFHLGDLIEVNATEKVFTQPDHQLTEAYGYRSFWLIQCLHKKESNGFFMRYYAYSILMKMEKNEFLKLRTKLCQGDGIVVLTYFISD